MTDTQDSYYRLHVFCCTNVRPESHPRGSCARKNAVHLRDYMKKKAKALDGGGVGDGGRIRVNASGCLDRCELGPAMVVYPEGVWYWYETEADIDEILERHVKGGEIVDRLKLSVEDGP